MKNKSISSQCSSNHYTESPKITGDLLYSRLTMDNNYVLDCSGLKKGFNIFTKIKDQCASIYTYIHIFFKLDLTVTWLLKKSMLFLVLIFALSVKINLVSSTNK